MQHVLVMLRQFAVERELALQEELFEVERRGGAANVAERAVRAALIRPVALLEVVHHHDVHTYNQRSHAAGEPQLLSGQTLSIPHQKTKRHSSPLPNSTTHSISAL